MTLHMFACLFAYIHVSVLCCVCLCVFVVFLCVVCVCAVFVVRRHSTPPRLLQEIRKLLAEFKQRHVERMDHYRACPPTASRTGRPMVAGHPPTLFPFEVDLQFQSRPVERKRNPYGAQKPLHTRLS